MSLPTNDFLRVDRVRINLNTGIGLSLERITRREQGDIVEYVESVLDPVRFALISYCIDGATFEQAIPVALAAADPFRSAVLSANIGDDTDTIGAIATAMAASAIGLHPRPEGPGFSRRWINTANAPLSAVR